MSLLFAPPVACPEGQAAYGLPAVPQMQNLDEHFAQVLARKLQADADAESDTPEPIALNWALLLAQGEELDAAQLTGENDTAEQIVCEPARADALQPQSVDARAALELDFADTTLAAQATRAQISVPLSARAPGEAAPQDADADSRTLDVDFAQDNADIRGGAEDAVGNVLQQIQTAKALKAAKAQAVGSASEVPGVASKTTAMAQTTNISDDARAMTLVQDAGQPANSTPDTLVSVGSTPLAGQNAPAPAASTATPAHAAIPVTLSHPQWAESLGQQVLHLARASAHEPQIAHLRLDPPELGPLRIAISLHDQVVQASFVSAHAPVRLAVETALTQLQEQLAEAGLSLGQTSVSDQGAAQQDTAQDAPTPRAPFTLTSTPASTERQTATPARSSNALIDTFV